MQGVVRDPALRVSAIEEVAVAAAENGLGVVDITASRLPGPAGNVEYFYGCNLEERLSPTKKL